MGYTYKFAFSIFKALVMSVHRPKFLAKLRNVFFFFFFLAYFTYPSGLIRWPFSNTSSKTRSLRST